MKKTNTVKSADNAKSRKTSVAAKKLGPDSGGTPKRPRKLDKNFKQSRDVREDRGVRQMKSGPTKQGK
jgi:hypothetical protein